MQKDLPKWNKDDSDSIVIKSPPQEDPLTVNLLEERPKDELIISPPSAPINSEENTIQSMVNNELKIFVHNTFTMDWELEPYFKLAAKYDYILFIVTVENYHQSVNVHDVSNEQLQKMAEKYKVKLV